MNSIKSILSLILFSIFSVAYILKLGILYKRDKIKANVLGKGGKIFEIKFAELLVKATSFLFIITWLTFTFGEKYITKHIDNLIDNPIINFIGTFIIFVGILIFIQAMISMKTSWRVGIDKATKTALVSKGLYKYSRNPAFVGLDFMFIGLFLTFPNVLTFIVFILGVFSIHLLILQEEKHLEIMLGNEYIEYKNKTPRYILFL